MDDKWQPTGEEFSNEEVKDLYRRGVKLLRTSFANFLSTQSAFEI